MVSKQTFSGASVGSPTMPPLHPDGLGPVLDRNITALYDRRRHEAQSSRENRIAEAVTRFTGSLPFVYLHIGIVALWILVNIGAIAAIAPFDESFVILATAASVEAIFLSTFVLISQNRASAAADRRADLDLQINLLAEHEITKPITLTKAIADRLDVAAAHDPQLAGLEEHVAPEKVLDELEQRALDAYPELNGSKSSR